MRQMKQSFLITMIFFLLSALTFQERNLEVGKAKVSRMNDVEVYFMSEPLREYKVVVESGDITDNFNLNTQTKNPNPAEKANQLVQTAISIATNKGGKIDAVIYSNANWVAGVQFIDEATEETKGISDVTEVGGLEVYAFSEPIVAYDIISTYTKGKKPITFSGTSNSSIEDDLNKLVNKIKKGAGPRAKEIDAVIYTSGKSGVAISYQ